MYFIGVIEWEKYWFILIHTKRMSILKQNTYNAVIYIR